MPGPDAPAPLTTEAVLSGRYRLVRPIARGGMADVWEGHDQVLSRAVAIKVLQRQYAADEVFLERFRREAVAAARLAHPGVVATFDAGVDGSTTYIVMELVRGDTLRQYLAVRGQLPPWLAVGIATQIADALVHAHRAGIIHRDIKPANILLCEDGDELPRVKVTDFGIAKATASLGADLTRTGMVLGTPRYLSPEQVQGIEPDARADLYALGVVTFEMLAGSSPFEGDTEMAMAMARINQPAPRLRSVRPDVPRTLDALVAEMLASDLRLRIPSATALRQALAALQVAMPVPREAGGSATAIAGHIGGAARGPAGRGRTRSDRRLGGGPAVRGGAAAISVAGEGWAPHSTPSVQVTHGQATDRARMANLSSSPTDVAGRAAPGGGHAGGHQHGVAYGGSSDTRADRTEGVGSNATRAPSSRSGGRRRRGRGPGLVVAILALAGLVVAGLLAFGGHGRKHAGSPGAPGALRVPSAPVRIAKVSVWIVPPQTRPDNPGEVKYTYDGNDRTAWQTAVYRGRNFAGLGGEGLAIHLATSQPLHQLNVTSYTQGWAASTYVSNTKGATLAAWGTPTARQSDIPGSATFDLGGRQGSWVLLWMTDTGPALTLSINELQVT